MLVNRGALGHLYSNQVLTVLVADDPMEDPTENPIAVKVEEHSQSLILTYFHGDISSMVDAHFSRALNKVGKAKVDGSKRNKAPKKIKEESNSRAFQDNPANAYPEPPVRRVTDHHVSFNPAEDLCSPWNAFPSRAGEGSILPSMTGPDGLSVTGQQCSASLLNLLHTDRTEMPSSSSKAELLPNWMVPQVDPSTVFEPGRRFDKKDLYWY